MMLLPRFGQRAAAVIISASDSCCTLAFHPDDEAASAGHRPEFRRVCLSFDRGHGHSPSSRRAACILHSCIHAVRSSHYHLNSPFTPFSGSFGGGGGSAKPRFLNSSLAIRFLSHER